MNKLNKITTVLALTCGIFLTQSCVKDDDFSIPPMDCTGVATTMTIEQLIARVDASTEVNNLVYFTENTVVEGYVISSDQTGNFYKTFSMQSSASNPSTKGIQVEIDQSGLYTQYPEGSLVQIQLNGLVAGYDRGVLKVGATYLSGTETRVGRMASLVATSNVKKTCEPIQTITPRVYNKISDALLPSNVNTLVTIKNVQFETPEADLTYGDAAGGTTVNRKLIDTKGKLVDLRNSGYASWAGNTLPTGSGDITVVVSIYNGSYQLYIRDLNDVKFDQPRFAPGEAQAPSSSAVLAFSGANFDNWTDFVASLGTNTAGNTFGLSDIIKNKVGEGINGTNALGIDGQVASNGPVFIVRPTGTNLPANPTKLHFWIKGTSGKSLNIYLYKADGTNYAFNVGALTGNKLVTELNGGSNSYTGVIDTNNEWKFVELDLDGLTGINTTDVSKNFLAFRIGNNTNYNLLIDNITVE
jgi:hypothetical protein